jgi:hypothetical protein
MCFWRGKILAIGLTLNSITAFHVYEDLLGPDFWLPVYNPEPVEFEIIPPEGAPYRQATYTHSFLSKERDCERLREALLRTQAMTSLRTDYAELFVLDSQRFVLTCLEELLHGRSIYGPQSLTADQQAKVSGALAAHRIAFENPDSTE